MTNVDVSGGGASFVFISMLWFAVGFFLQFDPTVYGAAVLLSLGILIIGFAPKDADDLAKSAEELE